MSAKYKLISPPAERAIMCAMDNPTREDCAPGSLRQNCDSKERNHTISRDPYRTMTQCSGAIQTKTQFGPLTMVDARGSRRNVASEPLHDGLVFDTPMRFQTNGSIYKVVAKQ